MTSATEKANRPRPRAKHGHSTESLPGSRLGTFPTTAQHTSYKRKPFSQSNNRRYRLGPAWAGLTLLLMLPHCVAHRSGANSASNETTAVKGRPTPRHESAPPKDKSKTGALDRSSQPQPRGARPADETTNGSPEPPQHSYRKLWQGKSDGWNHAVAILDSDDVLALASSTLTLHARHDGRRLAEAEICSGQALGSNAIHVAPSGKVFVACDDAVHEIKIPSLAHRPVLSFAKTNQPKRAKACAFGRTTIALADDKSRIFIHSSTRSRMHRNLPPPQGAGRVRSLAYATDGTLAAAYEDRGVWLLGGPKQKRLASFKHAGEALRFAPDSKSLFGAVERFKAGRVSLDDGFVHQPRAISSWLSAVRFLGPEDAVVTASNGTWLYRANKRAAIRLDSEAAEGLAVSKDGKAVCMGTRSKRLVCFRRGPSPAPSTLKSTSEGTESSNNSTTAIAATLRTRRGSIIDINVGAETRMKPGSRWQVSKWIEGGNGRLRFSAWLVIARVTVVSSRPGQARLRIDRRLGNVSIQRRNVNHFNPGAKLQLKPELR